MDDFEAFRKKRKQQQQAQQETKKVDQAAEELGWVDGLGPKGPTNPKVKGFVLGRYWQPKKVDPKELERPEGYEKTRLTEKAPGTQRAPTPPEELKKIPKLKGMRRY